MESHSEKVVGNHISAILKMFCSELNVPVPRALFAGEATHNSYFSTVHETVQNELREAERLIQSHHH